MDRAVIAKESSEPVESGDLRRAAPRNGSFARGFVIAAPLALGIWALLFWLI